MKILYLGDIGAGQTCLMRMVALQRLGHEVLGINTVQPWRQAKWLQRRLQRYLLRGSVVNSINHSVVKAAREFSPNLVWADKQEFLRAETIDDLRRTGARTCHFTPDPYFYLSWKRTRLMDEAIRAFDVLVYCKAYESKDYEHLRKPTIYMPLGFCDQTHRPVPSINEHWHCQYGFLGGWEPRREQMLAALAASASGLKIWGGYWDHLQDGRWSLRRRIILRQLAGGEPFQITQNPMLANCLQGGEVYGDDYARALSGAKIGLGFLRKVCPDQHTTRTFEIPACGSMLLADRTNEHQQFFAEGKEAEFFSSEAELLEKALFYQKDENARFKIAIAGRERCLRSRYSYVERMSDTLSAVSQLF